MADVNSAEYWKARAEAAWEREDISGLAFIKLRGDNTRQQVRIAELEQALRLADDILAHILAPIDPKRYKLALAGTDDVLDQLSTLRGALLRKAILARQAARKVMEPSKERGKE